jgi:hypothetical protein
MPQTSRNNGHVRTVFLSDKDLQRLNMVHEYGLCATEHLARKSHPELKTAAPNKAWSILSAEYRRDHQLLAATLFAHGSAGLRDDGLATFGVHRVS